MTRVQHPQPGARAEQRSSPTLQTTIRQPTRWEHGAGLSLASSVYNTIQFEFGIPGEILILNHFNLEAVLLMINIITLTIYIGGHLNFSFALSQSCSVVFGSIKIICTTIPFIGAVMTLN